MTCRWSFLYFFRPLTSLSYFVTQFCYPSLEVKCKILDTPKSFSNLHILQIEQVVPTNKLFIYTTTLNFTRHLTFICYPVITVTSSKLLVLTIPEHSVPVPSDQQYSLPLELRGKHRPVSVVTGSMTQNSSTQTFVKIRFKCHTHRNPCSVQETCFPNFQNKQTNKRKKQKGRVSEHLDKKGSFFCFQKKTEVLRTHMISPSTITRVQTQ